MLEPCLPQDPRLHAYHPLSADGPRLDLSRSSFSCSSRLISSTSAMSFLGSCSTAACWKALANAPCLSWLGLYHTQFRQVGMVSNMVTENLPTRLPVTVPKRRSNIYSEAAALEQVCNVPLITMKNAPRGFAVLGCGAFLRKRCAYECPLRRHTYKMVAFGTE